MKKWHGIMVICLLLLLAAACQKKNNNTPYPQISLSGFYPDSLQSGSIEDTAFILLHFFDGDADLTNGAVVKLVDSRTNDSMTYAFPEIDPSLIDPATGIDGDCVVRVNGYTLKSRTDTLHLNNRDTLHFTVHVVDVAGHESNRVTTPDFYLYR